MYFDTHCHLNFQAFDGRVDEVIAKAKSVGVNQIVIPGTDLPTSEKAVEIAEKFDGIYAAVGIHPHHVFQLLNKSEIRNPKSEININNQNSLENLKLENSKIVSSFDIRASSLRKELNNIEKLLSYPKVLAIGEVGIDRHIYQKTKYPGYKIEEEFVELQKIVLIEQIKLAHKYKKSLILHNREAKKDILELLTTSYSLLTNYSSVFHCCEPDAELLEFAKVHKMFIGVDGDITYYKEKQEWIKTVPLEMLVLETDSPFLAPRLRPARGGTTARQSNEPKNIPLIAEFVAKLKGVSLDEVERQTMENAKRLFRI
jgi:TatD DNase family protein